MKNFILTNKQLIGFIVACIFIIISCKKEDGKSSIDVAEYHKNILEAEKNILRKQYTKAEDHYNAAWHFIQTPFPEDIYNRMLCNRLIGDKEKLFDLLNELVETTGISMSKLKQRYRFLLRYSDKWATFKELYPSLIKNHNDKRITELTDIALQIQQLDQKYRKTEDRYTTYKQHNITADSINVRRLLELLENHGYPTAEEIGVLETDDNRKGFQDILLITFLHAFQNVNKDFSIENGQNLIDDLNEQLLAELHKGRLHPERYMNYWYGREAHSGNMGIKNFAEPPLTIINGNYYIKPIDESLIDSLNRVRKKMYLEDIKSLYDKALYMSQNPGFDFDLLSQGCCVSYNLKYPDQEALTAEMFGVVPLDMNLKE